MDAINLLLLIVAVVLAFAVFYNSKRISDVDVKATTGYATAAAPVDTFLVKTTTGDKVPRYAALVKVLTSVCEEVAATATSPVRYTQTITLAVNDVSAGFLDVADAYNTMLGTGATLSVYSPSGNTVCVVDTVIKPTSTAAGSLKVKLTDVSSVTKTTSTPPTITCGARSLLGTTEIPAGGKPFTLVLVPGPLAGVP